MRALSDAAASRGHIVTGSDNTLGGHDPKNVEGADLVVYTNAVPQDNCELVRARELNIPIIERAEYLGELARVYKTVIAVAGCHGKSTTTAMLGAALKNRRPTVHVGVKDASHAGGDKFFVTEACEYRASFTHLHPDVGVILNVQYDHPDYYKTLDSLICAYVQFSKNCKKLIVNGDDELCVKLFPTAVTFGTREGCDYRAVNIASKNGLRTFTLVGKKHADVKLRVAGVHNVYNALATIAAATECGVPLTEILPMLYEFNGVGRRFERKGLAFGKTILTDYAHHPTEIQATISAAREIFPSVAVVFQPHTYSRTQALLDDFSSALGKADTVVLAPIFAAREKPIEGVSSHALCRKIVENKENAYCFDTFTEILEFCKGLKEKALIFMGAGDIDICADRFIQLGMI